MAKVEVLSGKQKGESFDLPDAGEIKIGNRRGVQVPIRDAGIAVLHATILAGGGQWKLKDGASPKGTSVGGKKLSNRDEHALKDGDTIDLGGVVQLRFTAGGAAGGGGTPPAGGSTSSSSASSSSSSQSSSSSTSRAAAAVPSRARPPDPRSRRTDSQRPAAPVDLEPVVSAATVATAEAPAGGSGERVAELETEVERLQGRCQRFEKKIAELEEQAAGGAGGDLEQELKRVERELGKAEMAKESAESKLRDIDQKLATALKDVDTYKQRSKDEQKRAEKLEKELEKAKAEAGGGAAGGAELEGLERKLAKAEGRVEELTDELKTAQDEKRGAERERDKLRGRVDELEDQVAGAAGGGGSAAHEERIRELEQQLEEVTQEMTRLEEQNEQKNRRLEGQVKLYEEQIAEMEKMLEEMGA